MRPLWAAIPALLGLCGALVHGLVPAPQNVTVQCSDLKPRVYWNYSAPAPTNFIVELLGSGKSFWNQTKDHEFDLTDFVLRSGSQNQMFDYLYVNITAEQGLDRSGPSSSPSFSYNSQKTVSVTCNLTFPPVNLTVDGQKAILKFQNPLHFYKELTDLKDAAFLRAVIKTNTEKTVDCLEEDCTFSVALPEDTDPCVTLTGFIKRNRIEEYINVVQTGPVCAGPDTFGFWLVAILSMVIFIFVIVGLAVLICKTQAWIFPKIPTPSTLLVPELQKQRLFTPHSEAYSSVQIIGYRPGPYLLDPESLSPERIHPEDQVLIRPEDLQDDSGESTQTEILSDFSSSSEELSASNYERRPVLLEMDDSGDVVMGYFS